MPAVNHHPDPQPTGVAHQISTAAQLEDPAWKPVYGEIEFECGHWGVFENAIDMAHIHYLHADSFGNKVRFPSCQRSCGPLCPILIQFQAPSCSFSWLMQHQLCWRQVMVCCSCHRVAISSRSRHCSSL